MRKQILALIDCVIGDLTGLLIHWRSHSAAVEIIDRMTVIAESYAGTGNMDFAILQDGYYPDCVYGVRIDGAYGRVLYEHFFQKMRALHVK